MTIRRRTVVHFPGFEPLDAKDHRDRYARSAAQSAAVWNASFETGVLDGQQFRVNGQGPNWSTQATVTILDHDALITSLRSVSLLAQIAMGYRAALIVVAEGGMTGYFRHAWRFGLFFVFPFLFVAAAVAISLQVALLPYLMHLSVLNFVWSLPLAGLFFFRIFLPFSDRLHTLHLLADWRLAVHGARLDDAATRDWIARSASVLEDALAEDADEYLITAHSMGASLALHAIGTLLERRPDALHGKQVVFATLGGATLQCALLKSATVLRERIRLVAECRDVTWFEIQSLTDPVHLYKARTVAACGFGSAPQPPIVPFRFRTVLSEERYRRIKTDILRMHRQYVLGPDRRGSFDFTLMTAGPLPARQFRGYSQDRHPPILADGSLP